MVITTLKEAENAKKKRDHQRPKSKYSGRSGFQFYPDFHTDNKMLTFFNVNILPSDSRKLYAFQYCIFLNNDDDNNNNSSSKLKMT